MKNEFELAEKYHRKNFEPSKKHSKEILLAYISSYNKNNHRNNKESRTNYKNDRIKNILDATKTLKANNNEKT